ncbi:hypothetical protein ACVBE9_03850 [Eionea flava]
MNVPDITLYPSNLKVWAERQYDIQQGLTEGSERTYTIGAEGAALTSDTTVTIFTEWVDHEGNPFPEGLAVDNGEQYGLTGRFAKVSAANTLQGVGAGADLAEFPIAPGRQTQVVNVGSNLSTAEHYYIHVIGKPKDQACVPNASCPSFAETTADGRPSLRVPLLVPLADEDRHWQAYNANC